MLDKARYIVVEGPIGAGKTSLARRLADRLQAEAVFEQAELNPFLGRFYQQSERWGLATQLSFLFQRIDQLSTLGPIEGERRVVADFLFDKDHLFAEQNLSPDELVLYRRVHDGLQPANAPRPDLVICLDAPAEVLYNRKGEGSVAAIEKRRQEYLQLANLVEHFVVVDVTQPEDVVASQVTQLVQDFYRARSGGLQKVPNG